MEIANKNKNTCEFYSDKANNKVLVIVWKRIISLNNCQNFNLDNISITQNWTIASWLHSFTYLLTYRWSSDVYLPRKTLTWYFLQVFLNSSSKSILMPKQKTIGSRKQDRQFLVPHPSHSPSQHGDDPWLRFMWGQNRWWNKVYCIYRDRVHDGSSQTILNWWNTELIFYMMCL